MAEDDMADDAADAPGTIVDVAVADGSFTTLVAAVTAAGLVETLSGDGPFTVFAPTDDAFAAALDALGLTADELLASPDL
nr:fasciclin domain-containing protein [Actinomycetota bacterium]NIS30008.1 fasciclin domain-containing protein [Actinomycetota bacterium]NIT94806.1 fasciclin domain-containing protein [Actinomycetota bacterium]NIU18473.1 fasciclin domain-containing protein [Actinomycetota bacterium]NIU64519.1 fasciclin domain-containing protein [Actinomycetota bacterium]